MVKNTEIGVVFDSLVAALTACEKQPSKMSIRLIAKVEYSTRKKTEFVVVNHPRYNRLVMHHRRINQETQVQLAAVLMGQVNGEAFVSVLKSLV